jgi:hypothetical protein
MELGLDLIHVAAEHCIDPHVTRTILGSTTNIRTEDTVRGPVNNTYRLQLWVAIRSATRNERGPTYQLTQSFPSMGLAASHFQNVIFWFGCPASPIGCCFG